MNTFLKIFSTLVFLVALSACTKNYPNEGVVMSHFNGKMTSELTASQIFEKMYATNPMAKEMFGENKNTPPSVLRDRISSAKFKGCSDGPYDGQAICSVETMSGNHTKVYEFAYIKNGENWQFTGNSR